MSGRVSAVASGLLALLAFGLAAAAPPCRTDDKKCAAQALRGHVVQKLWFWEEALGRPLAQRIGPGPAELIEFIDLDNIAKGIAHRPRTAAPAQDFLRDLQDALAELPPQVAGRVGPKLAGIYLVEDIGSTGYTDQVLDAEGRPVAGFVVLDPAVLRGYTANAWATWKENTPFRPRPGIRLTAQIEAESGDSRKNAIQYILLHELGHVLAIGGDIHPSWNDEPKEVRSTAGYPFFLLSWSLSSDGRRYVTAFDREFTRRRDVVYYFGAKLSAGRMPVIYESLERTSFATLYAATNPFDDFAEAFASYVHSVLMQRPFEIRIYRDGTLAKAYGSCWEHGRCAEKRKILERLLGVAP